MKEFGVRCSSGEHSKSEEAGAKNLRTLAQLCSGKADEIGTRSQPLLGAIKGACQFPTDQIISSCSSQAGLADLWGLGKGRRGSMALIHPPLLEPPFFSSSTAPRHCIPEGLPQGPGVPRSLSFFLGQ